MPTQAYLYASNGKPIMGLHYSAPGRHFVEQESVLLDSPPSVGKTVAIHMLCASKPSTFVCVDTDGKTALLQRIASN